MILGILTFINENNLHNCIEWYVDLVGAHAVGSTVGRTIVAVTELFRVDLVVLGCEWCWR